MEDYIFKPFKVIRVHYVGSEIPRPRSGHRIACDDVNIYLFGGYNPTLPAGPVPFDQDSATWTPDRPLFRELWSFNISTRKWKLHRNLENLPDELASNALCVIGRYLVVFGGTGAPFGRRSSNDVLMWRTRPNDTKLQILQVTGVRPPGQYGQAVLHHDGYFYTVGGTNGYSYNCDIYRLHLSTLAWEPVFIGTGQEDEPFGRYRHEIARVDDKLYVIGGGTAEWTFDLMDIPMYDLKTKKWNLLIPKPDDSLETTTAPLHRKCHSAVQLNTPNGPQIFVCGGFDGGSMFDDVWRLNLSDLQWTLMQATVLPHPLYFHSSTLTSSGCMYVFGGIEPKANDDCRNNILYKCWLCIPKLSEMCWEAILHYNPNLDRTDRNTLLCSGVPADYVDRLLPV